MAKIKTGRGPGRPRKEVMTEEHQQQPAVTEATETPSPDGATAAAAVICDLVRLDPELVSGASQQPPPIQQPTHQPREAFREFVLLGNDKTDRLETLNAALSARAAEGWRLVGVRDMATRKVWVEVDETWRQEVGHFVDWERGCGGG